MQTAIGANRTSTATTATTAATDATARDSGLPPARATIHAASSGGEVLTHHPTERCRSSSSPGHDLGPTQRRGADHAGVVPELGDHEAQVGGGLQHPGRRALGDPVGEVLAELLRQAAADDDQVEVEQVDRRPDRDPEVSIAVSNSFVASSSSSSRASAHTLEVRFDLPSSSRMSNSDVCQPASTMADATPRIDRRPA